MRILNLYAGIGGNRKLWDELGDFEITAVENVPEIAAIYQKHFPKDRVVVADAHQYLLEHFREYDFIWSSPPCPSHSKIRNEAGVGSGQNEPVYPDMRLYEEILFLQHMFKLKNSGFKGKYCVENVIPYYKPLIPPQEVAMHCFWANFIIPPFRTRERGHMKSNKELMKIKGFEVNDKKLLRNCVEPELGKHILDKAITEVKTLFEFEVETAQINL